jgi:hypothetical protein
MLWLGLDGITSFSAMPLRMIATLGGFVCVFSIAMVIWIIFLRLFTDRALPGSASTRGGIPLENLLEEQTSPALSDRKSRTLQGRESKSTRTEASLHGFVNCIIAGSADMGAKCRA